MKKELFDENINELQKIKYWLKIVVVIFIVLVSIGFGIFYKIKFETIKAEFEKLQMQLLDQEEETITIAIIEEKLDEIAELATAIFEYSGVLTKDNYKELFKTEINIPFTKNEIKIQYNGVIKVGYDLEQIDYEIEEKSKKIYMSLPEPSVTDHYMKQDELVFEQKNNILNPISIEQINNYLVSIEKEELLRAEKEGIYKVAEEKIKMIIKNFLSEYAE